MTYVARIPNLRGPAGRGRAGERSTEGREGAGRYHRRKIVGPYYPKLSRQLGPDQSPREIRGVERPEVAGLFADADGVHWQAKRFGQCDHHTAARGAVQFGDHQAGPVFCESTAMELS